MVLHTSNLAQPIQTHPSDVVNDGDRHLQLTACSCGRDVLLPLAILGDIARR